MYHHSPEISKYSQFHHRKMLIVVHRQNVPLDKGLPLWKVSAGNNLPKQNEHNLVYSIIYGGNDTHIINTVEYINCATSMVTMLAENILNEGQYVYIKNWYMSMDLLDKLTNHSDDMVGPVHNNCNRLSKYIMNAMLAKGRFKVKQSMQCFPKQ